MLLFNNLNLPHFADRTSSLEIRTGTLFAAGTLLAIAWWPNGKRTLHSVVTSEALSRDVVRDEPKAGQAPRLAVAASVDGCPDGDPLLHV